MIDSSHKQYHICFQVGSGWTERTEGPVGGEEASEAEGWTEEDEEGGTHVVAVLTVVRNVAAGETGQLVYDTI